jgi:hypothetical protein
MVPKLSVVKRKVKREKKIEAIFLDAHLKVWQGRERNTKNYS